VTNKITGKGIKAVKITVLDTEAETDENGEATVVLPADKTTEKVTLKAAGYNDIAAEIDVAEQLIDKNRLTMVQSGKFYFLSNQSGKIDVVKSNLDGSDRQTVLAGTGNEDRYQTVLLASRDWKFLALHAKRESEKPKLYLINTGNDSVEVMDEGNADFTLSGWSGHKFVYTVNRLTVPLHEPKRQALKSFDADSKKLATLDETRAELLTYNGYWGGSYVSEAYLSVYAYEDEIVYFKSLSGNTMNFPSTVKSATVNTVNLDGSNKKEHIGFTPKFASYFGYTGISSYPYETDEVYFLSDIDPLVYEYHDGKVEVAHDYTNERFYNEAQTYPTYLLSPSGQKTFWSEQRDGKNVFNVGNKDGEEEKKVAELRNYQTYGWYTDDILLVSKEGSELYAMSVDGVTDEKALLKITDYYKPAQSYRGYGGGYGGL
jgi:hypothetical protein